MIINHIIRELKKIMKFPLVYFLNGFYSSLELFVNTRFGIGCCINEKTFRDRGSGFVSL